MTTQVLNTLPSNVAIVNPDGTPTREFLRAWLNLGGVVTGSSSVSAGVDPAVGGFNPPNFSMDSGTPASRQWLYAATNPNDWNNRAGQMTLNADFISTNYFTLNPGGHLIVALRCDLTALALGQPRFHGIILNDVSGAQEGAPNFPTTQIESRATGLDPGGTLRYLFPNSQGPASKPLADGVQYRLCIRSTLTENNQRFVRYQLWRLNLTHSSGGNGAWDLEVDTGDMLDANIWLDMTKYALAFASVFETSTALGAWSVFWSNISVTWAGIKDSSTDASARLSRYDALLNGNLTFQGNARRAYVYMDSTLTNFTDWTQFVSSTTNSNTSVVSVPNGTSVASNFLATNKSTLSGSFAVATFGMNGANMEVTSLGLGGHANPPQKYIVGSTTSITHKTTGVQILAAAEDIGPVSTRITGATSVGGANALALAASAQNFETYCTATNIAGAVNGAGTVGDGVETVVRPLWGEFSALVADLQAKKII